MLRELFDKGKCALGFHAGDWRYTRDRHCEQIRTCSRCKLESRQTVHTWQPWQYLASEACEMRRQCGRCREEENKVEHAWAEPVYETPGSCEQIRPCARCDEKASAGVRHTWDGWRYETHDQCSQISACSRCGAPGPEKRLAHNWGNWYESQFYSAPVRVCRRCAETVFKLGQERSETDVVSLQEIHRAVQELIESKDAEVMREAIIRHQAVLFSPVTNKYFKFAVDQLSATADAKDVFCKLAGTIDRCRKEGVENVFSHASSGTAQASSGASHGSPAQPAGNAAALDQRLIGHWRHTEILGSGGFSMTIDTHCILDASGGMQWYSRTANGTNAPESGAWSATKGTLNLKFDKGDRLAFSYVLEGANMFCPREGRYRLWERIN
jgi:hypothetical protein